MARPRLLLLDEPSLGLAPAVVEQMFGIIRAIHAEGVAILLVEQNVAQALDIADRAYVLEEGRVVADGAAGDLAAAVPHPAGVSWLPRRSRRQPAEGRHERWP